MAVLTMTAIFFFFTGWIGGWLEYLPDDFFVLIACFDWSVDCLLGRSVRLIFAG